MEVGRTESRALVTGGAGCIGSELAERLAARGESVTVLDNLSSGRREHLDLVRSSPGFRFVEGDVLDPGALDAALDGVDTVYHLAANPDVKYASGDPTDRDLVQNTIATHRVLEAMRRRGVGRLAFASTSAVYGISARQPIPEDASARPISLYGASKLACEALAGAFAHMFGMRCWIFRFANVVGPRVRARGRTVVGDFHARLLENPAELEILGDGNQAKSYLSVADCVDGMLWAMERAGPGIYNLGCSDAVSVRRIADLVALHMGLDGVRHRFSGGEGGWPGDVPRFVLDSGAMERIGWRARLGSEAAVVESIRAVVAGGAGCRR
jgi:UDP-glucose 4-epimerase